MKWCELIVKRFSCDDFAWLGQFSQTNYLLFFAGHLCHQRIAKTVASQFCIIDVDEKYPVILVSEPLQENASCDSVLEATALTDSALRLKRQPSGGLYSQA